MLPGELPDRDIRLCSSVKWIYIINISQQAYSLHGWGCIMRQKSWTHFFALAISASLYFSFILKCIYFLFHIFIGQSCLWPFCWCWYKIWRPDLYFCTIMATPSLLTTGRVYFIRLYYIPNMCNIWVFIQKRSILIRFLQHDLLMQQTGTVWANIVREHLRI